ncbi:hypothetical protein JS756_22285 [Streptomyces actuosus]|uniref:Thiopeptide-type bacteriocin biosynthesis domain-containing protein n=1 Tax=Streptomyces actuosus TaxID=1885 RepID=A0ABS2VUH8_STRAS|nr:hypothetical protein [Streptomyces actuosus]MBN0046788.1 hypothetical protein [Streptomyces actuosus]
MLRRLGQQCWFRLGPEDDAAIRRLMAELAAEHRRPAPGYAGVLRCLLYVLVVRAARPPGPRPAPSPPRTPAGAPEPWPRSSPG